MFGNTKPPDAGSLRAGTCLHHPGGAGEGLPTTAVGHSALSRVPHGRGQQGRMFSSYSSTARAAAIG